jgi:hypothetical protein
LIQINRLSGLVPPLAQCGLPGLADSLMRFLVCRYSAPGKKLSGGRF